MHLWAFDPFASYLPVASIACVCDGASFPSIPVVEIEEENQLKSAGNKQYLQNRFRGVREMVLEEQGWTVEYPNGRHSLSLSDDELLSAIQSKEVQLDVLVSHPRHTSGLSICANRVPEIKRLLGIREPIVREQDDRKSALVPSWRSWAAGMLSVFSESVAEPVVTPAMQVLLNPCQVLIQWGRLEAGMY